MFLDYLALVILLIGLTLVFYTFIYIHDLPYDIAKHREHPHEEAIHVACWLSLFTLHAIWPIVFIWAVYKPRPLKVIVLPPESATANELEQEIDALQARLEVLRLTQAETIAAAAPAKTNSEAKS